MQQKIKEIEKKTLLKIRFGFGENDLPAGTLYATLTSKGAQLKISDGDYTALDLEALGDAIEIVHKAVRSFK